MTQVAGLRAMLLAQRGPEGLLNCYGRALAALGADVHYWDPTAAMDRAARLGAFGRRLNSYVPVSPWRTRGNREFVIAARRLRPDVIFACCATPVGPGALAQIQSALPNVRLVLLWADTLVNLDHLTVAALPLYNLVATYSQTAITSLRQLGARQLHWVPFAGDTLLYPPDLAISTEQRERLACDLVFIGNPRPERDRAIRALLGAGIQVKVWGGRDWNKRDRASVATRRCWQGRPLLGEDYVRAARSAKLSLNIIDDTNFPAANGRFFENMAARVATLGSRCPEMEPFFPEGVGVAYFETEAEMISKAVQLLSDEERRRRIAEAGYQRLVSGHTYMDRVREVVAVLGRLE